MGFLFKCLVVIALVYLAANRGDLSALVALFAPQERVANDAGGKSEKQERLTELQRMAATKLMGAAREHCLAKPTDCLALLKTVSASGGKSDHKER